MSLRKAGVRLIALFLAAMIAGSLFGLQWLSGIDHLWARIADRAPMVTGRIAAAPLQAGDTRVTVQARAFGRAISPEIYGVSLANATTLRRLGATVDRWGGNTTTTYNWVNHCSNAARDWEFRNKPDQDVDQFAAEALANGATPLITVPTIGWVAGDCDNNTRSIGVPPVGGPPLTRGSSAIQGYDPARNRSAGYLPSYARRPGGPTEIPGSRATVIYQDEWVRHLAARFGTGSSGVRLFAMDNEPDIWAETHTDVHPVAMGYDAMLNNFWEYTTAVKDQEPSARVLGPDLCCWTGYEYSDLDRGQDEFRTHADRRAHGDQPFLAWWLQEIAKRDRARGSRSLDLLDVHYYPQADGVSSDRADPDMQARRIRSVRSLYDPSYTDESWVGTAVSLIPRLKKWIGDNYPGTGIAITEYNWGGEKDASGAVALAEALGVFGREGVDLATYWPYPPPDSPAGAAFRLYRNFDGTGATFGDLSLPVSSTRSGVRAFAARHSERGELDVVLVNESQGETATVTLDLVGESVRSTDQFSVAPGSSRIEHKELSGPQVRLSPLGLSLVRVRVA